MINFILGIAIPFLVCGCIYGLGERDTTFHYSWYSLFALSFMCSTINQMGKWEGQSQKEENDYDPSK